MTSINTNASATTALRTLQMTNTALETTQNRVATGLKIGEAKDNAAYWAISTTLKSDNKSLATVKEALNLGAATVDTAYQGLNKTLEVLDEIKSKLTAASQDGLNKNTIQQEISELKKQLLSISSSSNFSGENWLSIDSSAVGYNSTKSVVASFSRDSNNAVTIGTVEVDASKVSLYDASTVVGAGGILDTASSLKSASGRDLTYGGVAAAAGNVSVAGLTAADVVGAVSGTAATAGAGVAAVTAGASSSSAAAVYTTGAVVASATTLIAATDTITLTYDLGGDVRTLTVSAATYQAAGTAAAATSALITAIEAAEAATGRTEFTASTTTPGTTDTIIFTTTATGSLSNPAVFNLRDITVKDADGLAKNVAGGDLLTGFTESTAATFTTAAPIVFTGIAATDKVAFDLTIDGASVKTTVVAGNGTGTANIANLVNSLNSDATFASVATASIGATNELVITSGTTGTSSGAVINSVGFFDSTGTVKTLATASAFSNVQAAATTTGTSFIDVTLDEDDNIVFDINVNGVGTKTVKIDRDLVNETLDITTGYIDTIANYKLVLDAALTNAGVVGVTTTAGSTAITFSTTSASGTDATIVVTDLVASKGGNQLSVDAIDISDDGLAAVGVTTGDQVKAVLTAYISLVNTAITSVTEAASNLGSVASRIELQSSFVDTIIDTIEEGVSNLIDADLSEESTRLQALQTKQQLGIQALSIANASTQNVLALFQ